MKCIIKLREHIFQKVHLQPSHVSAWLNKYFSQNRCSSQILKRPAFKAWADLANKVGGAISEIFDSQVL